jgi:hypothetical protein
MNNKSKEIQTLLVEAENFDKLGGWVVDQQFMDQMGSPFLLAHGMGKPVKKATKSVEFPVSGEYRVWVRTRNWVAEYKASGPPGRFQLLINGKPLKVTFGTESAKWHWQDGGTVRIRAKKVDLALHDLTGFDGRCDAIVFTTDFNLTPPNRGKAMAEFRRRALGLPKRPPDAGSFDLVVAGGGLAGICTAISAARLGLKTALIHDRPVLGGNNSSEVRVHLGGEINLGPYPQLGNLVKEIAPKRQGNAGPACRYEDNRKLNITRSEKNISLFFNTHACGVEKKGDRIVAVIARDCLDGSELRFSAPLYADCTGDGAIGFLAGADFRLGREGRSQTGESLAPKKADQMVMGSSVQWYSTKSKTPQKFPLCPWAGQFNEKTCQCVTKGEWDWETGIGWDQIGDFEAIRDYGLRVVYGNWAFLKNLSNNRSKFANRKLSWVACIAGKRESRRLMGDIVLTEQDILDQRKFTDACVPTTWTFDLHYPEPENARQFPGKPFRSIAEHVRIKPYPIPFRCLYSRNVENLMMAGRNISVTHVALGTVRVMRTGGMMGEVLGMAASLCKKHGANPRRIYKKHFKELHALMTRGVPDPVMSCP